MAINSAMARSALGACFASALVRHWFGSALVCCPALVRFGEGFARPRGQMVLPNQGDKLWL
ncbi:MAG: hypothetical protein EBT36_04510 [Betaproteobacteria bacterium]|nr:hypothetical protein [Betaproteobacteria bacterium]NBT70662.1 hypothetical protein [Betaproteobacteria bacterium]NBY54456.1 hypothetical protein [Betaproteobacteria bacterium]NDF49228.1 hypothetical protein [Betaproteobacteria bacterium]